MDAKVLPLLNTKAIIYSFFVKDLKLKKLTNTTSLKLRKHYLYQVKNHLEGTDYKLQLHE